VRIPTEGSGLTVKPPLQLPTRAPTFAPSALPTSVSLEGGSVCTPAALEFSLSGQPRSCFHWGPLSFRPRCTFLPLFDSVFFTGPQSVSVRDACRGTNWLLGYHKKCRNIESQFLARLWSGGLQVFIYFRICTHVL
jgi:hypothetical protein